MRFGDRNKCWPEDLGGRRQVRQAWGAHSTAVHHDMVQPREDSSAPEHMHLTRTLSANRERAAEQSRRGEFREVEQAYTKAAKASGRRKATMSAPPATLSMAAKLSRNKKAKRGTADQRAHHSTLTKLRSNVATSQPRYRGSTAQAAPVLSSKASRGDQDWFATLNASSFAAGAQGVRRRAAPPAVQCKLELHGEGETWQEAYTRRYREVLLQRLMGVEAGSVELSEAWSHILASDEQGSAEPSVIELRAKVIEEFKSALFDLDS
eukprot:TRINITY_DN4660_c0_g1_i7.p1 TRINITY_DN4660_c0_g1~~TRINITY_DN4660_c0_g1_i7.p1  ORF type:complete len:265 (-),score=54.79 TRINITY_DN4660_c0_g1_i7:334-1128(-)